MRAILLVKTSSLGDVIHNLPVASDLRSVLPNVAIDWVVEESFADIPRMHGAIRKVIPVALRRWRRNLGKAATWQEVREFLRDLRSCHYDMVIDTQGLIKSAAITLAAHGLRCGHARETAREPLAAIAYDCRYAIPGNAHAVERNRWLAAAACDFSPDLPLRYGIHAQPALPVWTQDWLATGSNDVARYSVLLSATSRDDKLWPEAHWIALGQALAADGIRCVLPSGNPVEQTRAQRLAAAIPGALAAPPCRLPELASLIAGAIGVVGVDTGLTHLAAALGKPVVALYVATDPGLTGVHAGPLALNMGGKGQCPTPQDVLAALRGVQPQQSR